MSTPEVLEYIIRARNEASDEIRDVGEAAGEAAKATDRTTEGLEDLGESAMTSGKNLNDVKGVLSEKLAPALAMIDPRLGAVAAGLGRIAGFASILPALGPAFVPISIAILAVGAAVYKMRQEETIARQETQELGGSIGDLKLDMDSLAASSEKVGSNLEAVRKRVRELSLEQAVLNGTMTETEAAILQVDEELARGFAPGLAAAAGSVTHAMKALIPLREELDALRAAEGMDSAAIDLGIPGAGAGGGQSAGSATRRARIAELAAEVSAAEESLEAARQRMDMLEAERKASQGLAEDTIRLRDAKKGTTAVTREQAAAESALAIALKAAEDEMFGPAAYDAPSEALQQLRQALDGLAPGLDKLQELKLLQADLAIVARQMGDEEYRASQAILDQAVAAEQAARASAAAEAAQADRDARASTAQGYMTSSPSGALSSGLSNMGWIGAIIAAVLQLGEQGADGQRQQILEIQHALANGIKALPEMIAEVIPDITTDFTESIPEAIAQALPTLIAAGVEMANYLLQHLPAILTEAIATAIKDMVSGLFSTGKDLVSGEGGMNSVMKFLTGGVFDTADIQDMIPKFASGSTFVARTGLALVHQGEEVIQPGGVAARLGGGSGDIHIHMQGWLGADMLSELDRAMRIAGGRGLFQGS